MTALAVPPEAADVPLAPRSGRAIPQPLAVVFADLLPDEVRAKRRLRYVKRRLIFALIALVLLVGLGDALARQQTSAANGDLSSANAQIATYNDALAKFTPVLTVQSETQQIQTQLSGAMVNDVSWPALIDALARKAPGDLKTSSIAGQVDDPSSTGGTPSATAGLSSTSDAVIGSLTLSGTAKNYSSIAEYVVALSSVQGFTAVNPATVTSTSGHRLTFTLTLSLTSAILSGHYTPATATAAPAAASPTTAATPGTAAASLPATTSTGRAPSIKKIHPSAPSKKPSHPTKAPALAPVGD